MAEANQIVLKVLNDLKEKTGLGGVIDSWSDGNGNWWRKYADGWIEQGGEVKRKTSQIEVSLHVPMKDATYSVLLTSGDSTNDSDGTSNADSVLLQFKTASSFKVSHYAAMTSFFWEVKGY